jgi:GxxExxY protein
MKNKGISFQRQVPLTLTYKGIKINRELRIDILVEELVIVELKANDQLLPIHEAQLLSYLHQAKVPKGVLINFNEMNITKTLVPMVTKQFALLPDN